ncbi:hypothetical protein ES708_22732 [subsurface metagenome]
MGAKRGQKVAFWVQKGGKNYPIWVQKGGKNYPIWVQKGGKNYPIWVQNCMGNPYKQRPENHLKSLLKTLKKGQFELLKFKLSSLRY